MAIRKLVFKRASDQIIPAASARSPAINLMTNVVKNWLSHKSFRNEFRKNKYNKLLKL